MAARPVKFALLVAACGMLSYAQPPQPDGTVPFNLTASGTFSPILGMDNRQLGCQNFQISYAANGFSALTLAVQEAPDNTGSPGAWGTMGGTLVEGVNPNTNTTAASSLIQTYGTASSPWVRVALTSATGSGNVIGKLICWAAAGTAGTTASGGGGGGSNPAAGPTGSAVPADADYQGLNVGGTLRGQTGVNPTGTVYAGQTDLTSVGGTSFALGQTTMSASIPVAIASNQSAIGVTQSTTPWVDSITTWAGSTLGAITNYGTSPGAVLVPAVNAFITNSPAVTGTVTANQGTTPWVDNISQFGGNNVVTGTGASGNGIPRVTVSNDSNVLVTQSTNPWTDQGALGNNGSAATTNRLGTLPGIAQTSYNNGTASTQGRDVAMNIGTDGLAWTANLPSMRPASYTASAKFAASSTTDNSCMAGNGTNTVLVTELRITGTQTTAGNLNVEVVKRSAADTGGTSANMTQVPDDSNYAAAQSQPVTFTGTGPSVGAAVGDVDNAFIGFMATATASPNDIYIANWRQKPIVLRTSTAQVLCVNLGGAVTGGNMTVTWKWIETATITP